MFKNGGTTFINKGTNGRWRDVLTPDDIARYEPKWHGTSRRNAPNGWRRAELPD